MSATAGEMTRERLHLGIAEQGKLYALAGDHRKALTHYREAMRLAVESGAQEVFFRHYMECSLESLEHMGAFDELLEYCKRAIDHYEQHPPTHEVARLDRATILERKGIILLKKGLPEEARAALEQAMVAAGADRNRLLLATNVVRWLAGGLHVDTQRVQLEQKRRNYFVVRPGNVQREKAIPLPGGGPTMG